MKTQIFTSALCAIALLASGCGDTSSNGGDSEAGAFNTTYHKTSNGFSYTLTVNDMGKYSHIRTYIEDSSGYQKFKYGTNYPGTVTVECIEGFFTGSTDTQYDCTITYNTSSPVGDPSPKTTTLTLRGTRTYTLFQEGYSFQDSSSTSIATLPSL